MTPKFEIARAVESRIAKSYIVKIGDYLISSAGSVYAKHLANTINNALSGHVVLKSEYDYVVGAKRDNDNFLLELNAENARLKEKLSFLKDAAGRMAKGLDHCGLGGIKSNCFSCAEALSAYEDAVKDLEEK